MVAKRTSAARIAAVVLLLIGFTGSQVEAAKACTTGVIQLTKSACLDAFRGIYTHNGVAAACGAAFKVDVNSKGHIYMTPLEQGQFKWAGPGFFMDNYNAGTFQCKDINATGLFDGPKKKTASVMFYNDVQGPHSRLAVTGANKLTLEAAHTYFSDRPPYNNCIHNFTVVSGCVMGIRSSKPYSCPSGWYVKRNTKFGMKYCAPCPLGSSSSGPNASKCTPCKAGTFASSIEGKCKKCAEDPGIYTGFSGYSPKPGASNCEACEISRWTWDPSVDRSYTDGKSCKACPPDSWPLTDHPSQCVACSNGVKCCRTNPSKDCPPCKPGFKSGPGSKSATFVLVSAQPPECMETEGAICGTSFDVSVLPTCQIQVQKRGVDSQPCSKFAINTGFPKLRPSMSSVDVFAFGLTPSKVSSISGPFVTFKVLAQNNYPKACRFTYRSISAAGSQWGVPPAPCSPSTPGCVSKASPKVCPAGHYVQKNVDGNTLCLPCPPGHYAKSASSATKCTPCPAGKYAPSYGSTGCSICPVASYSSKRGSVQCTPCEKGYSAKPGSPTCTPCPLNSVPQQNDTYPGRSTRCIGKVNGALCCAAGDCAGQPSCPAKLPPFRQMDNGLFAVFQLQSKQLSDKSCRNAQFLNCLAPKSLVFLEDFYSDGAFSISPLNQLGCVYKTDGGSSAVHYIDGRYSAANRARFFQHEAVSFSTTKTMTIYFMDVKDGTPEPLSAVAKCSATFKLIAGYAFDLKPPTGAKCPAGTIPTTQNGLTYCKFQCSTGSIFKGSKCSPCPGGTYQPLKGGTKCLPCPGGEQSYPGSVSCNACQSGNVPKGSRQDCSACPANTYALPGFTKCKACPSGLVAPSASTACGVPFPKS